MKYCSLVVKLSRIIQTFTPLVVAAMLATSIATPVARAEMIPIIHTTISSTIAVNLRSTPVDNASYVLTARASQNIAGTEDYIDISDQTTGADQPCYGVDICSEAVTVDLSNPVVLSDVFVAVIYDGAGNVVAASLPMTIGNGQPGPNGDFGMLNINGYCQALGYYGALLVGPNPFDWICDTGLGTGPTLGQNNMEAGCQWQFEEQDVVAEPADDGTVNWNCWRSSAPGSTP